MPLNIHSLAEIQLEKNAPDLHLTTGMPPLLRQKNGILAPIEGMEKVSAEEIESVLHQISNDETVQRFRAKKDLEAVFEIPGKARFRATFFFTIHGPAMVARAIPAAIPTPQEIGVPEVILQRALRPDGLILVTGPNGSGKSTTLASIVEYINQNQQKHIVTIEDPIEFGFENKKSVINQRAVGMHTETFPTAIRHAVRQNVDVVVVGEMRDLETIATVITLAETGHLVLATLHTPDAPRAVQRIIDVFPAAQQEQIAIQLSHSLSAVMFQRLIPAAGGAGRVCPREVLLANDGVRHAIRSRKISEIYSQIQISADEGMQGFDDELLKLYRAGQIEAKEAFLAAHDQRQMRANIAGN